MDKATIFADVTRRNALRRANGLPLLDVAAEYAHHVAITSQRDYQAACDSHAGKREAIRLEVLKEYQARFGPQFGPTMGGRWAVGLVTNQRFAAYMVDRHTLSPPDRTSDKHPVTYGGDREDGK